MLLHNLNQEKSSYVAHINTYQGEDPLLTKYLLIDPSGNQLFDLIIDGVLLWLVNVAVCGTIDERAINKKRVCNPWDRNQNHMMCVNSAKAIGCTVVNIGTQDLVEGRKMCYCAETTMKLSGKRSSELSYIELDQTDWSFKQSIVCWNSRSSLGNSTAA